MNEVPIQPIATIMWSSDQQFSHSLAKTSKAQLLCNQPPQIASVGRVARKNYARGTA